MATINNGWITLTEKLNGLDVRRAFAGIHPMVSMPDELGKSIVEQCVVYYWQQELYPNGVVNKTERKSYTLENLAVSIDDVNNLQQLEKMVLASFIDNLGYPGIINPCRETLENTEILSVVALNEYPLHRDSRAWIAYPTVEP